MMGTESFFLSFAQTVMRSLATTKKTLMKNSKTTIPPKLRAELEKDLEYKTCSLYGQHGHICDGRITWEHAIIYAGEKVQARWAIIPLCASGHSVDEFQDNHEMVKELNEWVALGRASELDILNLDAAFERSPLGKTEMIFKKQHYLTSKYGMYKQIFPTKHDDKIVKMGMLPYAHPDGICFRVLENGIVQLWSEKLNWFDTPFKEN